jgi:hypothetical protein
VDHLVVRFTWVDINGAPSFLNDYWLVFTNDDGIRDTARAFRHNVLTFVVVSVGAIVVNLTLVALDHDGLFALSGAPDNQFPITGA